MSRKTSETASDAGSGELDSPALSVVDEPVSTDEKKKKKRGFLGLFKSKDKVWIGSGSCKQWPTVNACHEPTVTAMILLVSSCGMCSW